MVVVILTTRAIYKSFFAAVKYTEVGIRCILISGYRCYYIVVQVAGTADNPLYDVSPFADMKAEDVSNASSILLLTYHKCL